MKRTKYLPLAATLALVSACGKSEPAANDGVSPTQNQAAQGQVYSGTGKIQSITDDQVTIAHGPIEGIGWPAMAMSFTAPTGMAEGVSVGSQVDFSFRQDGSAYVLTSLRKR